MPEWLTQFFDFANRNAAGIGAVASVLGLGGGLVAWIVNRRVKVQPQQSVGRGGHGGNASVGGNGIAIGGRGGRAGSAGNAGDGGGAHVAGDGMAIGGDGGDAGVSWRPTLGAPSVMEHQLALGQKMSPDHERDEFGFYVVGRGGDSGDLSATVISGGHSYPLLPMVRLLRLWAADVLVAADATRPTGPQAFWDKVAQLDPATAKAIEEHMRQCLQVAVLKGLPASDPYTRLAYLTSKSSESPELDR